MAFLIDAYTEDEAPNAKGGVDTRTVLKLDPRLAPVKAAVLPLSRNERPLAEGPRPRRRAAQDLERRVRRRRRDRQALPPPGRDRHAVLHHGRLRDARRPRGHDPRARHDAAGAHRARPGRRLPGGAPARLLNPRCTHNRRVMRPGSRTTGASAVVGRLARGARRRLRVIRARRRAGDRRPPGDAQGARRRRRVDARPPRRHGGHGRSTGRRRSVDRVDDAGDRAVRGHRRLGDRVEASTSKDVTGSSRSTLRARRARRPSLRAGRDRGAPASAGGASCGRPPSPHRRGRRCPTVATAGRSASREGRDPGARRRRARRSPARHDARETVADSRCPAHAGGRRVAAVASRARGATAIGIDWSHRRRRTTRRKG